MANTSQFYIPYRCWIYNVQHQYFSTCSVPLGTLTWIRRGSPLATFRPLLPTNNTNWMYRHNSICWFSDGISVGSLFLLFHFLSYFDSIDLNIKCFIPITRKCRKKNDEKICGSRSVVFSAVFNFLPCSLPKRIIMSMGNLSNG